MTRVKKFALTALTALTLAAGVAAATPAASLLGDPSQWGIQSLARKGSFDSTEIDEVARKGSFDITEADGEELARKVNEYEGQHLSETGDPSQWG